MSSDCLFVVMNARKGDERQKSYNGPDIWFGSFVCFEQKSMGVSLPL
jgi:hypothetical protein